MNTGISLPGPDYASILSAGARLSGVVRRTPLLRVPELEGLLQARCFVKAESLQMTGSFKFRGACNALFQARNRQTVREVVACSSGNHGQGVALACRMLDIPATILMPADAPAIKAGRTRALGATVITFDRHTQDRQAMATALAQEKDALLIPPFEHPDVISGQGTVGLEIVDQLAEMDLTPDICLVPCSGGGLCAGVALAISTGRPGTRIHTVEPEGLDDVARSLRAGHPVRNAPEKTSICDSLLIPEPGHMTFGIMRQTVRSGLVVTDDEVRTAMRFAFRSLKLVLEPGGAVALAAALGKKIGMKGKTVVIICSGGNVDEETYASVIAPRNGHPPPGDAG